MKLTEAQIAVVEILRMYPDEIVMSDGYLTGGHGIYLNMRTVRVLKRLGLIQAYGPMAGRISELGKTCKLRKQ